MRDQPAETLFTTAISEAEIVYGLALMDPGRRRTALEQGFATLFEQFADRILSFDSAAARMFAGISAARRASGRPIRQFDAQVAAISRSRGAALATRNIDDFANCGIRVINPWRE
jgi:toxin FitB